MDTSHHKSILFHNKRFCFIMPTVLNNDTCYTSAQPGDTDSDTGKSGSCSKKCKSFSVVWLVAIPEANRFGELCTLFTAVSVTDIAARLRAHPPLSGSTQSDSNASKTQTQQAHAMFSTDM